MIKVEDKVLSEMIQYNKGGHMDKLHQEKGAKPLYLQIKDIYKKKILNGELKTGDKIESELEIQNMYAVSRITARQAILDLEKEGMVKRGRGRGTFVIWKPGIEEDLMHVSSFTQEMDAIGREPGTSFVSITKECMDKQTAQEFNWKDTDELMYCVRRVRTADDIKIVYMISYYPLSTNLPMDPERIKNSIYEILDYTGSGIPTHIQEKIRAELPNEETIEALNISKNQPILYRSRVSYSEDQKLVELSKCYFRGDLYSYTISTSNK